MGVEKTKREKFAEDPSKFYGEDEIVMAVIKNSNGGLGVLHGAVQRGVMEQALTRLTHRTYFMFQQMDVAAMMKARESEIVTPKGSGEIIT